MKTSLTFLACLSMLFSKSQPTFDWVKQWGGNDYDGAIAFEADNAGNLYVAGWFSSPTDLDPGPGTYSVNGTGMRDISISKFDAAGNFIWAKTQGGSSSDFVFDIALDASGNILTTGYFNGIADFDPGPSTYTLAAVNGNYTENYVSKLDPQGNFVWVKKFGSSDGYGAYAISTNQTGDVFVTGLFQGTSDFDPGTGVFNMTSIGLTCAFIVKLNANGDFVWAKQIGNGIANHGTSIALDATGNVYVAGAFSGNTDMDPGVGTFMLNSQGNLDIFVLKLDAAGNFVWARSMGGPGSDEAKVVVTTNSGNVYLAGIYASANIDFDPGPAVYTLPFNGWVDAFFMRLDATGNFAWCKGVGGAEYDSPECIAVDVSENLYIGGRFRMSVDFDPGTPNYTLSSAGPGSDDAFIMRCDPNGNLVWASQIHGNMNYASCLYVDHMQNVYIAGNFSNQTDFNPGPSTHMLYAPSGYADAYLLKLSQAVGTGIKAPTSGAQEVVCFPNPFISELTVACNDATEEMEIDLVTLRGELITHIGEKSNYTTLKTDLLPSGIYFVKITNDNNVTWKKVIKN